MKYYSETLKKMFESVEELEEAEKAEEARALQQEQEKTALSNEKKTFAKKIEEADEKVKEAYNHYDLVKEEAEKIAAEANKKIAELIDPAKQAIKDAEKERYNAIVDFNKRYGKYSVIYTGDRAFQEMKRADMYLNNIFKNLFWF